MSVTKLRIAPGLSLDADYVGGGTFALLAKKGAGKTYTGRVTAEEMWEAGIPFVVLDPMGAWWGLRSSADGESDGIPVAIFGGEHADAPLERTGGKLMADLVVEEGLSMILDMSAFGTRAAERHFALDFLERLYRTNRDLVHLFIDEADLFAPQKPQAGDQPLLGVTENIVRRGRNKGIGITLITQRSAVLNKDVLTQVDGLVAMRMLSPQDRNAIDDWVRDHGDMEKARGIKASLPELPNGECWWWIPELDVLKRVQVRRSRTFDSSPTKKRGERRREPRSYADVDMGQIESKMADTIERAKAEDPKELRRTIAEMRKQLAARPTETKVETVTETVEVPVLGERELKRLETVVEDLSGVAGKLVGATNEIFTALAKLKRPHAAPAQAPAPRPAPDRRQAPAPAASTPRVAAADGELKLGRAHRAILAVLDQRRGLLTSKRQLAVATGYSIRGGGFNNPLGALRTAGLIEGSDPIAITDAGSVMIAGQYEPLPTGPALLEHWASQLGKAHGLILRALADVYPDSMAKQDLADTTGYEVSGGGFNNPLGKLRTLELIEGSGELRLTDAFGEQLLGAAA